MSQQNNKVKINLNKKGRSDVDSVSNGEEFLTIAYTQSNDIYHCYQPNKGKYEIVSLSGKYVESISHDQLYRITSEITMYGDKDAWKNTPMF